MDREEKNWSGFPSSEVPVPNELAKNQFSGPGSYPNSSAEMPFWKHPSKYHYLIIFLRIYLFLRVEGRFNRMFQPAEACLLNIFSLEVGGGDGRINDARYRNELESLKTDYDLAVQKLNEFMYTIKTFWSPEVKRLREQRKLDKMQIAMLQEKLSQQHVSSDLFFFSRLLFFSRNLEILLFRTMVELVFVN